MKFFLSALILFGSVTTFAQTTGQDLIAEGVKTNVSPTELKKCNEIANKYSLVIENLEKIRAANVSALTEQEKSDLIDGIDEISNKRQDSLSNGAVNIRCDFTLSEKIRELQAMKVESLVIVTKNSPSLKWAMEEVQESCESQNGAIVGSSSCEKKRDGYSYQNKLGGQVNVLPDFECSQVCRVKIKH